MTETTAKKGMVRFKVGYSKSEFDFGFLSSINYDDTRKLKQVIETLFTENTNLKEQITTMAEEFNTAFTEYKAVVDKKLDNFDATFETNIHDYLTRGL
jgi:hypothetical protein